jgi:hypothetical protein
MEEKTPPKTNNIPQEPQYELIFKNGALTNLKSLALTFGLPEDDLKQVVSKSIKLLSVVKDAKILTFENQNGERFNVDVKRL